MELQTNPLDDIKMILSRPDTPIIVLLRSPAVSQNLTEITDVGWAVVG